MSTLFIQAVLKISLVLLAAVVSHALLYRRASAASRHLVWTLAVVSLLLLPALSAALPSWEIQVVSSKAPDATPIVGPAGSEEVATARPAGGVDMASPMVAVARQARMAGDVPWATLLPVLYAVEVLLLVIRLGAERWTVRRLARHATVLSDPDWTRLLIECARRMGVRRPVRLLRSLERTMPMTFGIRLPAILIPSVAETWPEDRRRAVLLHELAHVARHDCLTQLMAAVACAGYWIHPGVWWVARRLRVERELACDDLVLGAGTDVRVYAGHLLELAYTLGGDRAPALAVSMARPRQLEGRLLAVLDASRNRTAPALRQRLAGLAVMVALVVPLAAAETRRVPATVAAGQKPAVESPGVAVAAGQTGLPGTWEIWPAGTASVVQLRLSESGDSSYGVTIPIERLEGLSAALRSGAAGPVRFNIRRDAGDFALEGTFRSGVGAGTYTFTFSLTFPAALAKRGFERPTPADQYMLARADIGFAFLDELTTQGYAPSNLSLLVRAARHGVSLDYLREMGALGYRLGRLEGLVTQVDHGVSPQYIRELRAQGLARPTADDLVRARDHGVSPQFIRELTALGYQRLSLDELIGARDHGISPEYVRDLRALGYQLTLAELTKARDHGVSAEYIRELTALGSGHLSLDELIGARDHGISPEYVRDLRALGYQLTLAELTRARDHGVSPEYIRELTALGYEHQSLDSLVRLRDQGAPQHLARHLKAMSVGAMLRSLFERWTK